MSNETPRSPSYLERVRGLLVVDADEDLAHDQLLGVNLEHKHATEIRVTLTLDGHGRIMDN